MGYARIVSGGADGRYVIELDYGAATKTAYLEALSVALARNDVDMATQQAIVEEAEQREAEALANFAEALDELVELQAQDPGGAGGAGELTKFFLKALRQLEVQHAPLRQALATFKLRRAEIFARIAYWNQFAPIQQRVAWCADLTTNLPVNRIVATCEVPGDSSRVLVAPAGRGWNPTDGYLRGRELSSPAQSFFNAAIFPGWQKFRPTYRTGTATDVDVTANAINVALDAATSTAQGLGVNQNATLVGVPVQYMTCNAGAFEVGDRVLVQFVGQSWANPRVIGFADNPYSCTKFNVNYTISGHGQIPNNTILAQYPVQLGRSKDVPGHTAPDSEQPHTFLAWRRPQSPAEPEITQAHHYPGLKAYKPVANVSITAHYSGPEQRAFREAWYNSVTWTAHYVRFTLRSIIYTELGVPQTAIFDLERQTKHTSSYLVYSWPNHGTVSPIPVDWDFIPTRTDVLSEWVSAGSGSAPYESFPGDGVIVEHPPDVFPPVYPPPLPLHEVAPVMHGAREYALVGVTRKVRFEFEFFDPAGNFSVYRLVHVSPQ